MKRTARRACGKPLSLAVGTLSAWLRFATPEAAAQTQPLDPGEAAAEERPAMNIEDLSLEDLLNPAVSVATKSTLHAAQTPAIVTVVTSDDIQARGYASLAEILRSVPGFYDVYDGVTHNVGVRGINGGQNAGGSVLKLMIDGQAVDYRPSSGNFFGEELIPIEAIERVEIIRGPASALYGADAFLGAINVVTRSGGAINGVEAVGQGARVRTHPGGGGGLVLGAHSGPLDVLLAANYLYLDRSGRRLPATSPILDVPGAPSSLGGVSHDDTSEPASFLGKVSLDGVLGGTVTLLGSIQRLDAHGAFQAYGPLDPRTRVTALNQTYRLSYNATPIDKLTLTLSGAYFNSAPTADAIMGLNRSDYAMIPSVSATGQEFTAEAHFIPHRMLSLTAGGDIIFEDSDTETYDQRLLRPVVAADGSVLRAAGTVVPGEMHGLETEFQNVGAFAQGMLTPTDEWTAITGIRLDHHNIYGSHVSARAGVVYSRHALSLKLLYGSSFKAPSAEQLYARPIAFGGVLGNPLLHAQTAQSGELAVDLRLPGGVGDIQVNGFVTNVRGRVEFLPTGSYVIANNTQDEWVAGGELASHFVPFKPLRVNLIASIASTVARSGAIEGLLGKPVVNNALFPEYQVGTIWDYTLPWDGVRLSADLDYVGPRPASFSNSVIQGAAYDVAAYLYTAVAVSAAGPLLSSNHRSRVALRITDVLNRRWSEPGFGGVDIPSQGTTALLTLVQGL